jgi:hypothetical protein
MKKLLITMLAVPLAACGPSSEEKKIAEEECPRFIKEQMSGAYEAKVFDIYSKKGKVVAEVGYKDRHSRGDSYSVRLCVLDREKGTISSPSPLNDSEWKK